MRYELPKLSAFNFVLDDVLEGGVNASLGLDGHGKSLSFLLLTLDLEIDGDPTPTGTPPEMLEQSQGRKR